MPENAMRRRRFLTTIGAAGASAVLLPSAQAPHVASAAPLSSAQAASPHAARSTITTFVGSFTSASPPGHGLEVASLDLASGTLTPMGVVDGVPDASFLAFSPDHRRLYTTNEQSDGSVTAVDVTSAPKVINRQPTRGAGPTHLTVHPSSRFLLTANYTDGSVVVHRLEGDGSIGESTDLVRHVGTTRDPHAHQVLVDPSGERIVAVDLGADSVYVYSLDTKTGKLRCNQQLTLPNGTGPRHLSFHPNGRYAYVLAELNSTITVLSWNGDTFAPGQVIGTREPGAPGENFPAEIAVSIDGRFVHISNRGDDNIATFGVGGHGSTVEFLGTVRTGGTWPRHIALTPDETALYVANQRSGTVTRLARNPATGVLSPPSGSSAFPAVAMLAFHT